MRILYRLTLIIVLSGSGILGNHLCDDCPPSISPVPTDSPAPSPSPSEVPTDTQKPSVSLRPSRSPSEAPSTSAPSDSPSSIPTESPAPSPSPSLAPTMVPSARPSISFMPTKSSQPSVSFSPSAKPSRQPSRSPSISPRPSISASPSDASIFMISPNNEVAFEGLDDVLNRNATNDFETIALAYLTSSLTSVEADKVAFQTVRVTNQFLKDSSTGRQGANPPELHVLFDVAALVSVDDHDDAEPFNYNNFIKSRFDNQAALNRFNAQLTNSSDYFESTAMVVLGKSQPVSQSSETSPASNNVAIIASLACVSLIVGGVAAAYWLRRTRKSGVLAIEPALSSCENIEEQYEVTMKPTETYESVSYAPDDDHSEMSTPMASYPGFPAFYQTSNLTKKDLDIHQRLHSSTASVDTDVQDVDTSLMFRPAFLTAESNIEIPITPMTNYDMSNVSPKSDKGIGLKAWPSPHSQDDNEDVADECLVRGRIPVQPPREPLRLFGFGQRTKQNNVRGRETERKAGDEQPSIERCHSLTSSDVDMGWKSFDNTAFPSLFSATFPKSAWQQEIDDDGDDASSKVLDSKVIPTSKSF